MGCKQSRLLIHMLRAYGMSMTSQGVLQAIIKEPWATWSLILLAQLVTRHQPELLWG